MSIFNQEQREKVRRICARATPGPWRTEKPPLQGAVVDANDRQVMTACGEAALFDDARGMQADEVIHANAEFAAAARELLPLMLKVLEEAESSETATSDFHRDLNKQLRDAGEPFARPGADGKPQTRIYSERVKSLIDARDQALARLAEIEAVESQLRDEDKNPEYAAFWRRKGTDWVEWAESIVGVGPDELTMWGHEGLREQVKNRLAEKEAVIDGYVEAEQELRERLKVAETELVKLRAATLDMVVVAEDMGHICRGECGDLQEAAHDLKVHHEECVVGVARAAMGGS